MYMLSLLLVVSITHQARSSCYVSQTSSIRREVLDVIPLTSLGGCQSACNGDSKVIDYAHHDKEPRQESPFQCEATLLNAAGTHCILLGSQIADASSKSCPAPFTAHVKTTCEETTPLPQPTAVSTGISNFNFFNYGFTSDSNINNGHYNDYRKKAASVRVKGPIDDYYTVGECSRESDIVGTPTEGATPPCGTPPLSQRRIVIDAIKADGTHMVIENNLYSSIKWDTSKKSWYFEIESDSGMNAVYFYTAKCVLPPVTALAPNCECAALNTESAYPGNYNPVPVKIDTDPCCTKDYVQMNCVRAYSTAKTYSSGDRLISCVMGEWLMLRTGSSHYNSYIIRAAACVD
ncbi:hypothetical protein PRIPAC_79383 [Pristionchus pacificus]|uniref:Uncharacterized protein n=1 Tax=Pristionchus pacificus TaxID=54126 RepID=A0A2A6CJH2_PRIPA|nr:hypothetical protein PRIPAC_79383 [Pristionchus pacificus]|eukprot:PDM78256.1 hypothetical protein PRIPAC_30835 [Pristionchus pacificus]